MTTSSGDHGRPRALIVEDEILIALALEAEVKDLGFDVCGLAANANQAIAMAMQDEPDLAIIFISMALAMASRLQECCAICAVCELFL
jgi:DNA-binding NarL/FixJ family response regulator